jgi:hypothetical protein
MIDNVEPSMGDEPGAQDSAAETALRNHPPDPLGRRQETLQETPSHIFGRRATCVSADVDCSAHNALAIANWGGDGSQSERKLLIHH